MLLFFFPCSYSHYLYRLPYIELKNHSILRSELILLVLLPETNPESFVLLDISTAVKIEIFHNIVDGSRLYIISNFNEEDNIPLLCTTCSTGTIVIPTESKITPSQVKTSIL